MQEMVHLTSGMMTDNDNLYDVSMGTSDDTEQVLVRALFNGVRYGMKAQVFSILEKSPLLVNSVDAQGYSLVHWAAKKGDVDILQLLSDKGALLHQPTSSDTRMLPIHWAASEGRTSSINFLLGKRHQDINAQDSNGCTPVIIAAQHNQINCVIYLVKSGADMSLKDNNQDTAMHWAAYKGYVEMVGLLTYFMPNVIDCDDNFGQVRKDEIVIFVFYTSLFGDFLLIQHPHSEPLCIFDVFVLLSGHTLIQTPLHLAALRGNTGVVEHMVVQCGADCTKKDRNGLNPLELSVKKKQLKTEWALRKLTYKGMFAVALSLGLNRLKDPT